MSYKEHEIWPIHSFQNQKPCLDNRLGVVITTLSSTNKNPAVNFKMRSFRFKDNTELNEVQEQKIKCVLMLDNTSISYEETECDCFNENDCSKFYAITLKLCINQEQQCR